MKGAAGSEESGGYCDSHERNLPTLCGLPGYEFVDLMDTVRLNACTKPSAVNVVAVVEMNLGNVIRRGEIEFVHHVPKFLGQIKESQWLHSATGI